MNINEKELNSALVPEETENGVYISDDVISTISSGVYTSLAA